MSEFPNPYEGVEHDALTQPDYAYMTSLPPAPPIPPPPPKRKNRTLLVALIVILCTGVILGGVFFIVKDMVNQSQQKVKQPSGHSTPFTVATHVPTVAPTSLPTLTPTPTMNPNYTAVTIMQEINAAGIHPKFVEYNRTIWSWTSDTYSVSVNSTSSVDFTDDSSCTGNCSPANLGIWVYSDAATAQQAYAEVANDTNQLQLTPPTSPMIYNGTEYVHGRCLLLGSNQTSLYGQIVTQYCV